MNTFTRNNLRGIIKLVALLLLLLVGAKCMAQYGYTAKEKPEDSFQIRDINVDRIRESSESGSLSKVTAAKFDYFWYRISVSYSSRPDWADGVVFKYYALLQERKKDTYTMLVNDIMYDSVPKGSLHYSFMFIHPRIVERYGKPEKVMCEVWYQGIRITRGFWPKSANDEWWVRYRPLEGNLQAKLFTPFLLDKDMKEENINIKYLFD